MEIKTWICTECDLDDGTACIMNATGVKKDNELVPDSCPYGANQPKWKNKTEPEPEKIQGYTREEWQEIIDGGYLCEFRTLGKDRNWNLPVMPLGDLRDNIAFPFESAKGDEYSHCRPAHRWAKKSHVFSLIETALLSARKGCCRGMTGGPLNTQPLEQPNTSRYKPMINKFKEWLRVRREEREALERLELEAIEKEKAEAQAKCDDFMRFMFKLNCPFNNEKCNSKCVHFMGGRVYELPDVYGSRNYVAYNLPRCLLWNKK
jgi:hypothetical protein